MRETNYCWNNREQINQLYIHDSEFTGYQYDYDKHQIQLTCENYYLKKTFHFVFHNVVYHNMQSCSFWGSGNSILCVYLGDRALHDIDLPIADGALHNPNPCRKFEKHMQVVLELNSGDIFNVFCDNAVFWEEDIDPEKFSLRKNKAFSELKCL